MTISVQTCRETIARNSGAMRKADGKFFTSVEQRFEALSARSYHPADYRRLHNDIVNWGEKFSGKENWNTEIDGPVYDGVMAWADLINAKIENELMAQNALGGAYRPSGSWVNAHTGQEVRIYDSTESLAVKAPAASSISVGDLIAAKLFGTDSPAVQAALQEGTDSAGGYTVPVFTLPQFIDKLRSATAFIQAGAKTMLLDTAQTKIARIAGDPTAAWRAESAAINVSDPTLSALTFSPKSLAVIVKMSRELLADSINISEIVQTAMINAMALELDRACLFGTGASNQPLGLFSTSGINTVSMGTNGATPTSFDNLLDAVYELELDNARGNTAAIWHPRTAKTFRKLKDTTNQPLRPPAPLDTLPFLATTAVPITQTQGTNSDCSTVFMGYFPSAIVGIREWLNIRMLNETYAATGEIGFVAHLRADVQFEHPEEFCTLTGVR